MKLTRITRIGMGLGLLVMGAVVFGAGPKTVAKPPAGYPEFSWDTVPLCIHFGKTPAVMTDAEVKFVASRSPIVCLEKSHARQQLGSTEKGIAHDAKRLKAANPKIKVLFYWNSFINYKMYDACAEIKKHPDWIFRDADGKRLLKKERLELYNLLDPKFRAWWAQMATKAVKEYNCDGIFVDAMLQPFGGTWLRKGWGIKNASKVRAALEDMLTRAKTNMGKDSILLYNGIRSVKGRETKGAEYLPKADGVMVEHFTAFHSATPEAIARDIAAIQKAGRAGKIVIVKGWPSTGLKWLDGEAMKRPPASLAKEARQNITFSLACYLVAAERYSYFCYSWGYRENNGSFVDYPEFSKPLGAPKAPAVKTGNVYTRSFAHAEVRVDIAKRAATIQWKK